MNKGISIFINMAVIAFFQTFNLKSRVPQIFDPTQQAVLALQGQGVNPPASTGYYPTTSFHLTQRPVNKTWVKCSRIKPETLKFRK